MGTRNLSKKELEELRKKEEEEAAAHVFKEFVETFQEVPSTTSKVWVKAGTYDAGARKEDTSERGKLYKPVSRLDDKKQTTEADMLRSLAQISPRPESILRSRAKFNKDKKKSNLELFKEELRQIQEERSERHKYKNVLRERGVVGGEPALDTIPDIGSYDTGDPNTTNLYLGNLNPKITEQQLMEIFGRYGPLASIKIMWPRSDEEKARGRNCGFVAFMSRKDGERALRSINGKEIMSYEMKLGWGKAVVIPPVPIYIPPVLQQPSKPPPPSGLPFNAQPPKHLAHKIPRIHPGDYYPHDLEDKKLYDQILSQSIVKVVVPTERNILMLIHRMVEFVIREGPMFEAIIMNRELNNPFFRFLFENQSPAHVYYRWKLFSMLQGDSPKQWALHDFRMFQGGSVWRPPMMNLYTAGMPDELVEEDDAKENIRGTLSNSQRDRLEELIRGLTPARSSVGEAMAWCLEHAEAAGEVAQCLAEALAGDSTAPPRRAARLYLLSDVLHNAGAKLTNASAYRSAFQSRLPDIMRAARAAMLRMGSRLQQEGYRARVARVLQAWADWAVYPTDFLLHINDIFLGHEKEDAGGAGAAAGAWPPRAAPTTTSTGCQLKKTSTVSRWRVRQIVRREAGLRAGRARGLRASCPRAGRAWSPPPPSRSPKPSRPRRTTPRSHPLTTGRSLRGARAGPRRSSRCRGACCATSRCACCGTGTSWSPARAPASPHSPRSSSCSTTAASSSRRLLRRRKRRRRRCATRPLMTTRTRYHLKNRRSLGSPVYRLLRSEIGTVNENYVQDLDREKEKAIVSASESARGRESETVRGRGGAARRPRPPPSTTGSTASTPNINTDKVLKTYFMKIKCCGQIK